MKVALSKALFLLSALSVISLSSGKLIKGSKREETYADLTQEFNEEEMRFLKMNTSMDVPTQSSPKNTPSPTASPVITPSAPSPAPVVATPAPTRDPLTTPAPTTSSAVSPTTSPTTTSEQFDLGGFLPPSGGSTVTMSTFMVLLCGIFYLL